ncbi:Myb-related protein like [Heracleum sosnowskyi]|uniref:Myb-related protein like n=1 Tax=Heracleum sosnowskyi TaxID=360622 RepID=A0AAD8HJ94_9APIA|nr:Myb-related protein like [Heracleum sosnowskyi]
MKTERIESSSQGGSDGPQRAGPSNGGRTSGPTRRSTKGQWTPEEDEILRQAVQRFNGKNWKKIAECFKERTDVQCLHRWQKVLNPELVKGPWSKEEDDIIIQLVEQIGPKKWSSIAQHLPGRIGKQCRERWHNHLNPSINKDAWTLEEEMALIRAHQVYGNKWAELTKFLPGRTDNSIKNHWNSSVKKKLDSYLESGLLAQFQSVPQSLSASSSRVQQYSGDNSIPRDVREAEETSECSQASTALVCSQSTNEMVNATEREDLLLIEQSRHGKELSSSPVCHEISCTRAEMPCEIASSGDLLVHSYSRDWITSPGKDWQLDSNGIPNNSLQSKQESTRSLHCIADSENHEGVPSSMQSSGAICSSALVGNIVVECDQAQHMLVSEHSYPEARNEGSFTHGYLTKSSTITSADGFTDSLLYQSSDYQIPECANLASNSYYSFTEMMVKECLHPFSVPSEFSDEDGGNICSSNPDLFSDHSHQNQEEELLRVTHDGFTYTNDNIDSHFNERIDSTGQQNQPDTQGHCSNSTPPDTQGNCSNSTPPDTQGNCSNSTPPDTQGNCSNSTPGDNFSPTKFKDTLICPPLNENPVEHEDAGGLFYEPPRFPSLDIPFLSCDLIQTDMEQEYSPLGIRRLMTSSMNSFTPLRMWDSPSRDNSPDGVLKSAAKSFTCTPSILKKRHRDLVSPLSEKRREKKFESSFSNLTKDFSRLEVLSDENGKREATPTSPSTNLVTCSNPSEENKENLNHDSEIGEQEGKECTTLIQSILSIEEIVGYVTETESQTAAGAQTVQEPSAVLDEKMYDMLSFSPDQFGVKSNRHQSSSARTLGSQYTRRLEAASSQVAVSKSSESPLISILSPSSASRKKGESHPVATSSIQRDPSSAPLKIDSSENFSIMGETPFKRIFDSPSAWKSPWFMNSFVPGPRIDTDITIEDIGFFMSPGERSYDAIGLMKQLSEHTAAAFADAQEVLGDETPDSILKKRCSNKEKVDSTSNIVTERRTLDFSECDTTPRKGTESGRFSAGLSFSSPSSYLLKGCR